MKHIDRPLEKIVEKYQKDLQIFIEKNDLDPELSKDIEERIFEKIEKLERPTRKGILAILSEIGTPEEIFSDEISEKNIIANNSNNEKGGNIIERMKNYASGMIFLGVFKSLADIFQIPAFWIRLVVFIVVISLIPVSRGLIIPLFFFAYFFAFLVLKTRIFSFFFFLGFAIFFGLCFFGAMIVFVAFLTDFHYANMHIFHNLNIVFPIGITVGVLSLFILFVYFIARVFRKKMSVYVLLLGVIFLIIGIACGVIFVTDMVFKYSREEIVRQTFSIPKQEDTIIRIYPKQWGSMNNFGIGAYYHNNMMYGSDLEPSDSENIEISLVTEHHGSNEIIAKSKQFIEKVDFFFDTNGVLESKFVLNSEQKFPLLLIRADVDMVKIPVGQKFSIISRRLSSSPTLFDGYEKYLYTDIIRISRGCSVYFYDKDKNLHCEISDTQIADILSPRRFEHFSQYELERYQYWCQHSNETKNTNFNCDFMESEMERNQEYCKTQQKQGKHYYQHEMCYDIANNKNP